MSNSQKISQFNALTSLLDTALITVVSNGQNFTIPFSDFKNALGVTGTLSTEGDPLGVPVLIEPSPSEYKIRNIESSKGVIASTSPDNGVLLGTSFINGPGAKIIKDLTQDSLTFRALIAGSGINVSESGDQIQISAVAAAESTKTIIVSQLSDLPSPIGGAITLVNDTDYLFVQDITTSDRFILSNNTLIRGTDSSIIKLTYTGTDTMFTGVDVSSKITLIRLDAPLAKIFDITGTVMGKVFQLINLTVDSCTIVGDFDGLTAVQISDTAWNDIKTNGITFSGNSIVFVAQTNVVIMNGGTFLNLGTSTFDGFTWVNSFATLAAGTALMSGLVASGNINVGGLGSLVNTRIFGLGSPLSGITADDVRWNFLANDNIQDTRPDSLISLNGNITETVISTINTPVMVMASWSDVRSSQFTNLASGRSTYNGEKNATVPITFSFSLLGASGGDKQATAFIAINGVVISDSKVQLTMNSSKAGAGMCIWQKSLAGNDYIEVFVENNSDTTNIVVSDAVLRIN